MHVPGPDTRVVELRVHGVLGTEPRDLTDSVASVDVAGDGTGRIVSPADRLLRPIPGPDLTAGERTVPRSVEGYVWGGMTSGRGKALWALLFPFALANLAHWMLPPVDRDSHWSRSLGALLRAGLRLAGLLLTMLFTAQLTVLSLDLVAAQCLRAGTGCLSAVPDELRAFEPLRSVPALLFVVAAVFGMYRLSAMSWQVRNPSGSGDEHSAQAPRLPGAGVVRDPSTPALRTLHAVAALCTVVLLALGGPTAATDPRWVAAAAVTALCVLGTLLLDDPTGSGDSESGFRHSVHPLVGRYARILLLGTSGLLLLLTALFPTHLSGPLPGSGPVTDSLTLGLLALCGCIGALLLPAALLARRSWRRLPSRLRPWAGGWFAAPVLLIACLLGAGFGAGLTLSARQVLGTDLLLPASYDTVTLLWGAATAALVLAGLVVVPWAWLRWWRAIRTDGVSPEVELLHAGRPADQRSAERAWKWAELQRRHGHRLVLLLAGALTVGAALALVLRLGGPEPPFWGRWLLLLGVGTLATLAATLLRMVHLAVRRPNAGRQLSLLCDLTLFWPRDSHPIVPPCYALKVIPELVDRACEHLADPNTRVVLSGHSQGSLLASVAAARLLGRLDEQDHERIGLVTAGSQLQWAYARGFPGFLGHEAQRSLAGSLAGQWRSLCRGTDPIGGAVGTWNRQVHDGKLLGVGFRPDGSEGPLPAAARGPTGALVLGSDHWLPDPQRGPFEHRRWTAGLSRHSEYSGDPEWDRAVSMAAALEVPARGTNLPLRTTMVDPAGSSRNGKTHRTDTSEDRAANRPTGGSSTKVGSHPVTGGDTVRREEGVAAAATELTVEDDPDGQEGHTAETTGTEEPTRLPHTELPEIIDLPGMTPPWERGPALRPSSQ
ncbi:hypothetical protein SAMN04487819_11010 [Actinopolyspora alba]|uniref:Lipase (Class 3) n=1 Tax=Actinopolyspora alba TaxID=673379 RepID=A0A1I1Z1F1_9ACTN|nr:hypothetical protein [Actinopolyspora alba]SFE25392.1 hypothetical protein SAMN04487819_11010 [Actinopolyspora alba]